MADMAQQATSAFDNRQAHTRQRMLVVFVDGVSSALDLGTPLSAQASRAIRSGGCAALRPVRSVF
jgi:hypothetical protein